MVDYGICKSPVVNVNRRFRHFLEFCIPFFGDRESFSDYLFALFDWNGIIVICRKSLDGLDGNISNLSHFIIIDIERSNCIGSRNLNKAKGNRYCQRHKKQDQNLVVIL